MDPAELAQQAAAAFDPSAIYSYPEQAQFSEDARVWTDTSQATERKLPVPPINGKGLLLGLLFFVGAVYLVKCS